MPVQLVPARPWEPWAQAGMVLLLVLAHYASWEVRGRELDFVHLLMFLSLIVVVGENRRNRITLLSGPVLRVGSLAVIQVIPLAAAEIIPVRRGWQVRWTEGRAKRRISMETPQGFRESVARAAEHARAAPPGEVPRTVREAELAVPLMLRTAARSRAAGFALGILAVVVLSVWTNHPGFLFALPVLFGFHDRIFEGTSLVLCDGTLWFLGSRGVVHRIPLAHVRSVEPVDESRVLVRTDDPRYPALKLVRRYGGADALVQLRKALAGEPLFSAGADAGAPGTAGQAAAAVQAEQDSRLRCSLCGKPVPVNLEAGEIYICEACQNRARYEAQEAGHGLQGREPLPM